MTTYIPSPLFDNLPELEKENNSNLARVQSWVPEKITKDVAADYQLTCRFLTAYRGSAETFKAYRRELERHLQWIWCIQIKSLKEIRRQDIEAFLEFCQSPPKEWIGLTHVPRFINKDDFRMPNANWRPFVATISKVAHKKGQKPETKSYNLSQNAMQSLFAILSSFYQYLTQEEYIYGNPVAQIRQKSKFIRKQQNKRAIRRLSELQWAYLIETAEIMANENAVLHERTLFIMNALYAMYLRISELTATSRWMPQMGHFFRDRDGNWWFKTVSKGNKERDISVSDAMLSALKRYRTKSGYSPLPAPGEVYPLIPKFLGQGAITDTRYLRRIVQACFDKAIARLKSDGFIEEAELLMAATVHWLRHTGISEDVKIRPREHVRDDAGHSSSAITDQYVDIELRERHASGKKKLIKTIDIEVVEK